MEDNSTRGFFQALRVRSANAAQLPTRIPDHRHRAYRRPSSISTFAIMSSVDSPAAPIPAAPLSEAKKKKKSRSEKRAAAAKANPHERTKTVVRRLPPNLPEEIFWQSVQKWVSDETVVWKSFVQGKLRKK